MTLPDLRVSGLVLAVLCVSYDSFHRENGRTPLPLYHEYRHPGLPQLPNNSTQALLNLTGQHKSKNTRPASIRSHA